MKNLKLITSVIITATALTMAGSVSAKTQLNTSAKPPLQSCPFTDTFSITDTTISSLSNDGNIATNKLNQTQFTTGCKNNTSPGWSDGSAYLSVIDGHGGLCKVVIDDGPYEMNPSIASTNCSGGLQYTGMDHSYGTYSYTLKFAAT